MATIQYQKMSGAGNTFIVFEGNQLPAGIDPAPLVPALCDDTLEHGGADGLMVIDRWDEGDFAMKYFNRDGSTGMMCGNGGRCAVRFAADHGYVDDADHITFVNAGVVYRAAVTPLGIRVGFPEPRRFDLNFALDLRGASRPCHFADVGTPHAVIFVDEIGDPAIEHVSQLDLNLWGRELRQHPKFAPAGANANFVERENSGIRLRTFERGVEAETGACGTGAISSAIIASLLYGIPAPVPVVVTSGATLHVNFRIDGDHVREVSLEGDAETISRGEIDLDRLHPIGVGE